MQGLFIKKLQLDKWIIAVRAYTLSISLMSCLVPLIYSFLRGGNLLYGIIASIGVIALHLATNIFDDIIDYSIARNSIKLGKQSTFNFQPGKCLFLIDKTFTLRQYAITTIILMIIPALIGIYFLNICGTSILTIIIPTMVLCLLYPILGCLGLGELIIALVFSPLLYLGINFVMTGSYSLEILLISISTGLLAIAVLHNHMLLDFNIDESNRKTTLCRLCGSKKRALYLLGLIIFLAYINTLFLIVNKNVHICYLLTFLSLPTAIELYKVMNIHIKDPNKEIKYNIFMGDIKDVIKAPKEQQNFLLKFSLVRNVLTYYTFWLCIAMVIECILLKK